MKNQLSKDLAAHLLGKCFEISESHAVHAPDVRVWSWGEHRVVVTFYDDATRQALLATAGAAETSTLEARPTKEQAMVDHPHQFQNNGELYLDFLNERFKELQVPPVKAAKLPEWQWQGITFEATLLRFATPGRGVEAQAATTA